MTQNTDIQLPGGDGGKQGGIFLLCSAHNVHLLSFLREKYSPLTTVCQTPANDAVCAQLKTPTQGKHYEH